MTTYAAQRDEPDLRPVMFVHGLGGTGDDWQPQIDHFRQRRTVVAFDQRGHGDSAAAAPGITMADLAADAAAVIDASGRAPVHVVGLSLGGMVAMELAVRSPDAVASITVVNTGGEVLVTTTKEKLMVAQRSLLLRLFSMRRLAAMVSGRLLPGDELASARRGFIERMANQDKGSYRACFDAIRGWSVLDRLGEVSCPVLAVSADQDYSPVEAKQAIVDAVPDGRLVVVEDSRHATPIEHPKRFNAIVDAFIDGVDRAVSQSE